MLLDVNKYKIKEKNSKYNLKLFYDFLESNSYEY